MHPREFISTSQDNGQPEIIHNLPFINLKVNNINLYTLIDTGSEQSCISEEVINKYPEKFVRIYPTKSVSIVSINGKKVANVKYFCIANVELGNEKVYLEFLIVPAMKIECILGVKEMSTLKVEIDMFMKKIMINSIEMNWEDNKVYNVEEISICNFIKEVNRNDVSKEEIDNIRIDVGEGYEEVVKDMLGKYPGLFNEENRTAKGYVHKLEVSQDKPFHCKNYPIPFKYKDAVRNEINNLLDKGIIERANTPYINSIVIVVKKDSSLRMCLDARPLNRLTTEQRESPLQIESILGRLNNVKFLTTLDLKHSFWLLKLDKESRKYTGFMVDGETYCFRVVPFGLASSCAGLVRALRNVLQKYENFCLSYVDDLLIFSDTEENHITHVSTILKVLDEAGLKLNVEKSKFFKQNVKFLGYEVNTCGVRIDNDRLKELLDYPPPMNIKGLRRFLGVINYYKRFINKFAEKAIPLYRLLKKGTKWKWGEVESEAFEELKKAFYDNISLIHPNFNKIMTVRCDASDYAISAELVQDYNGGEVPIYLVSRILKDYEQRYSIAEKEMLAIVFALEKMRFYLIGNYFNLETDNQALTHILKTNFSNRRIYRWTMLIQEYNFNITHRPGKENIMADALTRKEVIKSPNEVLVAVNQFKQNDGIYSLEYVIEKQGSKEIVELIETVREVNRYKNYKVENNILIKEINGKELYVLSLEGIQEIAIDLHRKYGHCGARKLWLIFRENYFAKNDYKIIKLIAASCYVCQCAKYKNHVNESTIKTIKTEKPLDMIAIDYLGNLVTGSQGYKNILVIVDVFSKYVKLYPTQKCNTKNTIHKLEAFIKEVGKPRIILADNATYFKNEQFINHWENKEIKTYFCSIRHPSTNVSERYIQEVVKLLRILTFDNHAGWVKFIPQVEKYVNEVPNTVTEESPIYILTGEKPERPWVSEEEENNEVIERAREKLNRKKQKWLEKANAKVKKKTIFEIGDRVLLRSLRVATQNKCAKLILPFEGPYIISKKFSDTTYELIKQIDGTVRGIFHINLLYPYKSRK